MKKLLLASSVSLLLAACAGMSSLENDRYSEAIDTVVGNMPTVEGWIARAAQSDGDYWLLWYGDRPGFNLRQPDGSVHEIIAEDDSEQAPSGLDLFIDGETAWLGYRNKLPQRDLYLRRVDGAHASEPVGVAGSTLPLARFRIHVNAQQGHVDALWYGEADGEDQEYNLYTRRLDLQGRPVDVAPTHLLAGYYPMWINDAAGNQAVVSWDYNPEDSSVDSTTIKSRARKAGASDFGEPVRVRSTTKSVSPPLDTFMSGDRWFVYWIAQHGKYMDDLLLEGAWSDDQGESWNPWQLDDLRGADIESVSVAARDGQIILALSVAAKDRIRHSFREIYIVRSDDNGLSWNRPEKLRDDAVSYAKATSPRIAFLNDGSLFVVWEDWREIRSRLRYALSEDAGKSWLVRDARLPAHPGKNLGIHLFAQNVIPIADGGVQVIAEEAVDEQFLRKSLLSIRLDAQQLRQPPSPLPLPSEKQLRQAVSSYWESMVKKEYETTYNLNDPFFRAYVGYTDYRTGLGKIEYDSFVINEIRQQGNLATVRQTVVAGVPAFFDKGKLVEVPKKPRSLDSTWLWIDDGWYRQSDTAVRPQAFTRY